ncbi:MAG: toll/interleukin-1 receptor domain-containing protein [Blastocatellia bacterium]
MQEIRVFISYSHDSPEHSERVLDLAWALQSHGIEVEIDQFHNEEIVDWPRWCNEQTSRENSEFVVCVCTAEYKRRIDGKVPPEKGKGVYWEGSLLDDDIYDDKDNSRLIPLLFGAELESSIPRFLRGWTHCRANEFTLEDPGYEHLLRILTKQASVEKNKLGVIPTLPTRRAPINSPVATKSATLADISRIIKYAPHELIGRAAETQLLNDAWAGVRNQTTLRPHILTFVALGGEGKTSLVSKWAAGLAAQGWPDCDAAFAWSFYHQGTDEKTADSSDLFLKSALDFLGNAEDQAFAASNAGAYEKGERLARVIARQRCLLLLDGVEPLQYAPASPMAGQLKDQGLASLLNRLAARNPGLCIVTTRYSLPDLQGFRQTTAPEYDLKRLSRAAGVQLLQSLGVKGSEWRTIQRKDGDEKSEKVNEFEKLVEDVQGHALTLTLLGGYLHDAHGGDIRQRDRVKLADADAESAHPNHAAHVMDAYVQWFASGGQTADEIQRGQRALAVLRLMGLFDRPATADCLHALWQGE